MYKHQAAVSVAACLVALAAFGGQSWSADPRSSVDLKRQFVQAAERMEQLADSLALQASVNMVFVQKGGASPGRVESTHEIACRGNSFLLRKDTLDNDGATSERISCRNDKYLFVIEKSSVGTELVFLQEIVYPEENGAGIAEIMRDLAIRHPVSGYHYVTVPLWEFTKMPGFEVLNVAELEDSLVRIEHTIPLAYDPDGPEHSEAYMVCDSSQGWALVETGHTLTYPDQGIVDTLKYQILEFSQKGDALVATARRSKLNRADGSYSSFTEFESSVLDDDPSKEIFYLSYYGIPEPNFTRRRFSRRAAFLVLASAGCLICWLLMTRRRRSSLTS